MWSRNQAQNHWPCSWNGQWWCHLIATPIHSRNKPFSHTSLHYFASMEMVYIYKKSHEHTQKITFTYFVLVVLLHIKIVGYLSHAKKITNKKRHFHSEIKVYFILYLMKFKYVPLPTQHLGMCNIWNIYFVSAMSYG